MMSTDVTFASYLPQHKQACLELFDANCPDFFAPNERQDYENFLDAEPGGYELCWIDARIMGAFGLIGDDVRVRSLNWILLNPASQGLGVGTLIMKRLILMARASALETVNIAASHLSEPFFARFGATTLAVTDDGWGPGLHRVDMILRL